MTLTPLISVSDQGPGVAAADITENTVDVYIGYLRRRFAGPGGGLKVETVRGFGFRLSAPETA